MKTMSISKQVRDYINKIEPGVIFGLNDFNQVGNPQAVILELSRLFKSGVIQRLTKGKYFIPKKSKFGRLDPDEWLILDKVIKESGGYFAGNMALNRFGVTTQVPTEITIRGAKSTRTLEIGHLTINFLRQGNADAKYDQSLSTDIIEAARLIKRTPDGSIAKSIKRIRNVLANKNKEEINELVALLKNERPYVRAIIGALLEESGNSQSVKLKSSLNPVTKYKIGIDQKILPNKQLWGIT